MYTQIQYIAKAMPCVCLCIYIYIVCVSVCGFIAQAQAQVFVNLQTPAIGRDQSITLQNCFVQSITHLRYASERHTLYRSQSFPSQRHEAVER